MDKLEAKKKKRVMQKKLRLLVTLFAFVVVLVFALFLDQSKPEYLFANIPLKNSQAIIVEGGSVIEISDNSFVLNTGVSK